MSTETGQLHIDRSRAGIEQHWIEMGVKDDAAARAVSEQVEFGRAPNGNLLMKRGKWIASPISYQRECAQHILSSLAPEDMKNFRDDDGEDDMWAAAKRRLSDANGSFSRPQLLEQKREWSSHGPAVTSPTPRTCRSMSSC